MSAPHCLMLKPPTGPLKEAACDVDGKLVIVGEIETTPAVGGATSAKQDEQTTALESIDDKLPALGQALAAASVPVVLTAAQVSTLTPLATVTATQGTAAAAAAPWTVQPVQGGAALYPAAAALSNAMSNPTTTLVGACMMAYDSNASQFKRAELNSSRILMVATSQTAPSTTNNTAGTGYVEQVGINTGFSMTDLTIFAKSAGYILLVNKGSAAVAGDAPLGGHIYPIQANSTLKIHGTGAPSITFSSGLQVVFSTTPNEVTLGGTAEMRVSIRGA